MLGGDLITFAVFLMLLKEVAWVVSVPSFKISALPLLWQPVHAPLGVVVQIPNTLSTMYETRGRMLLVVDVPLEPAALFAVTLIDHRRLAHPSLEVVPMPGPLEV